MNAHLALQFRNEFVVGGAPADALIGKHGKEGGKAEVGLALPGAAEGLKSGIGAGGVIHIRQDYPAPAPARQPGPSENFHPRVNFIQLNKYYKCSTI